MVECWKPVPGHEDFYQVSDRGRVRRIVGGKGTYAGRVLRPSDNCYGYFIVTLCRNGRRKRRRVHILVAHAFLGPCPPGLEVNHKNGMGRDNKVGNLEYATRSENLKHSYRVLEREVVAVRGEQNGQAKLTTAMVKQIRQRYAQGGVTQCALGAEYGVSHATISRIFHRKKWVHVA